VPSIRLLLVVFAAAEDGPAVVTATGLEYDCATILVVYLHILCSPRCCLLFCSSLCFTAGLASFALFVRISLLSALQQVLHLLYCFYASRCSVMQALALKKVCGDMM
jgi:hypothetical protein